MPGDFSNDNNPATETGRKSDSYAHAALLLIESLIHGLIEREIITVRDAVEIVDSAVEVKRDVGPEIGDSATSLDQAIILLKAISGSLQIDIAASQ